MLSELLLFDSSLPAPSMSDIFIYTIGILIVSNLVFVVLCSAFGVNVNDSLDKEKSKEYIEWKKRKLSPWSVLASEIVNSAIYSPIAEELAFRVLLMKYICMNRLGMDFWTANIIQATVFGGIHLTNNVFSTQSKKYTNLQTLSALITGLVSGWAYYKCNSILPSLLSHVINNGVAGVSEAMGYWLALRHQTHA